MMEFIPDLFLKMLNNAIVVVFGEAARATVDRWKCLDGSNKILGNVRLTNKIQGN